MLTTQTMNADFDCDLKSILPRLRVYAMSLTRDMDRADDLVQQTALKALAASPFAPARISRAGCSASSATSSSRDCDARVRP